MFKSLTLSKARSAFLVNNVVTGKVPARQSMFHLVKISLEMAGLSERDIARTSCLMQETCPRPRPRAL